MLGLPHRWVGILTVGAVVGYLAAMALYWYRKRGKK